MIKDIKFNLVLFIPMIIGIVIFGIVGIYMEINHETYKLSYWLDKEYWRKGIASVAIQQISEVVFSNTDIVRLFASVFSGNEPSMQLLLKSGFKQEAVLENAIFKNGSFFNNHVFAKLR